MFWHRTREEPAPPPEVAEDAAAPVTDADGAPLTCWQDAVNNLLDGGYVKLGCPGMCRRKGDHAHLRHEAAATDLTVYPAVVERGGA